MNKRVFVVHGWDESPDEGWFPWLKGELKAKGLSVHVPKMPDAGWPKIGLWVNELKRAVNSPDPNTFFIGHSVGGQAIIRFLETQAKETRVGGMVLVASWLTLKPEATPDERSRAIAKPWLETPIEWQKVEFIVPQTTVFLSDNDPFVPLTDGAMFQNMLGAEVITVHEKGHIGGDDRVTELPEARDALLQMVAQSKT